MYIYVYLVGSFNPFAKKLVVSQNGNLAQIGVKTKINWNHHPDIHMLIINPYVMIPSAGSKSKDDAPRPTTNHHPPTTKKSQK